MAEPGEGAPKPQNEPLQTILGVKKIPFFKKSAVGGGKKLEEPKFEVGSMFTQTGWRYPKPGDPKALNPDEIKKASEKIMKETEPESPQK